MPDTTSPLPMYRSKRVFDVIFALFVLILLTPLILFFLIAIFIEHIFRGRPLDPLLYHETRYSAGKPFELYKFNIFKYDVVLGKRARGEFIQTKELERNGDLLLIGKLLKQIYLDELPQFLNVLRGDMSVVGPRPVNRQVFELLHSRGVTDKSRVRAGITGHYQACHKSERDVRGQEILDQEYVSYYESNPWYKVLLFDLKIMLRTIIVLLHARGI